MYSSISKHDGVNYSHKLSELRKINPNPAHVSHDSISHEQVLSSTESSSKSVSKLIIALALLSITGFFVVKFVKKKKKAPLRKPSGAPKPKPKPKPQWVIQIAVLLGLGGIMGVTWMILKKSGRYNF